LSFCFWVFLFTFSEKMTMNRKPENEKKSCVISFRVNSNDKQHIENIVRIIKSDKSTLFREHCKEIIHSLNIDKL